MSTGNKKVSVLIPTYNAENFIGGCLTSIIGQSYKNIEIIVINDGSKDKTSLVIEKYINKYNNIKLHEIENHGQGYCRNLALTMATGEYIMFVDADDFLEKDTIKLCVEKIENENSDLVMFDWKYYNNNTKKNIYNHYDAAFKEKVLNDKNCLKLLNATAYFSVNKLYRKQFLIDNEIKYLENYIYEDNPFLVKAASCAKRISILQYPLYNVRINPNSSTKTNYDTDFHYNSFLTAVHECIEAVKESKYRMEDYLNLYKYLINRFQLYRRTRVPKKLQKKFTKQFVKEMRDTKIKFNSTKSILLKSIYRLKVFEKNRVWLFSFLLYLRNKRKAFQERKKQRHLKLKKLYTKYNLKNVIKRKITNKQIDKIKNAIEGTNIVLFMGFDYRYTGNSRYLYEQILSKKHEGIELYFATDNELVDEKHRVKPRSPKMLCLLQHAKIVIFESWVPLGIKKQPGSIWIQLFHGTPIKKMLFDSNEKEILSTNKNHKINKVKDMNRWTYLLADSDAGSKIFQRAFQFDKKRILTLGYPRVKYLKDNINNKKLIREIKKKYHIPYSKKVISYLPTWRDYNYNDGNDFNYLLDIDKLKEELGDKYLIIAKDHSYLSKHENTMDIETQELLLISDYLITDYSSVMFDAFAINLKTILYINDFKKYQASRGIYEEIWNDIKPLAVDSISKLKDKILNYKIDNTYKKIKEKYTYNNKYKIDIADIIIDYFDNKTSSGFVKSSLIITDETTNVLDSNRLIREKAINGFRVFLVAPSTNNPFVNNNHITNIFINNDKNLIKDITRKYNIYESIDMRCIK